MNLQTQKIRYALEPGRCYVHARGLVLPNGFGVITMQQLNISGSDVFHGIEVVKTFDGGKSFSEPTVCANLMRRTLEDGTEFVMCDATPFYHKKTGKIILTGHSAMYGTNNRLLEPPCPRHTLYSVYDEKTGEFGKVKRIDMPQTEEREFFSAGSGCGQIWEQSNGDLLIPIYFSSYEASCTDNPVYSSCVLRCSFDGEKISLLEIGRPLSIDQPRGLYEPSLIRHNREYFLTLRNDRTGYVAKSADGLSFDQPCALCFEDGENIGNYNTQQHWLTGGGKLWLVYTRRAQNNDHVFRHRAPLFIAEFDPEQMSVLRGTEKIAVPERGARLGNFGCQSFSEDAGFVFAAEWMQNDPHGWEACAEYGSDNSIYITKISF